MREKGKRTKERERRVDREVGRDDKSEKSERESTK